LLNILFASINNYSYSFIYRSTDKTCLLTVLHFQKFLKFCALLGGFSSRASTFA